MEPYDAKIASLTYLANPIYQQILKQQTQSAVKNNKSDIKFYRKRITSLTKDMLKGEIPDNSYIKTIYENYVNGLIKYFKMVDTSDIIQQQYLNTDASEAGASTSASASEEGEGAGASEAGAGANEADAGASASASANTSNTIMSTKEINIDNAMMRKHSGVATLDNFVIKQPNVSPDTRIIPLIIDVDLTEPSLKKKGVKEKVKKPTGKEKI